MGFWSFERLVFHLIGPSLTAISVSVLAQTTPDLGGIPWHSIGPTGAICAFCGWLLTKTIPEMQRAFSASLQSQQQSHATNLQSQEDAHERQFKTIKEEWSETRQDIRQHVDRMIATLEKVSK